MHDISPPDILENWHPFLRELILWIAETVYCLERHAFYGGATRLWPSYPCTFREDRGVEQQTGVVDLNRLLVSDSPEGLKWGNALWAHYSKRSHVVTL
jgi:hypothetical protein